MEADGIADEKLAIKLFLQGSPRVVRGSDDGCELCLLKWVSPNPIVKQRDLNPLLRRRADRSKQCLICSNVHNNWPSDTVSSVKAKLKNNELTQADYDAAWERYVNGANGVTPRCRRSNETRLIAAAAAAAGRRAGGRGAAAAAAEETAATEAAEEAAAAAATAAAEEAAAA